MLDRPLSDLVSEIASRKKDPKYSHFLAHNDSSIGVTPVVTKLPRPLHKKWTSKAVKCKADHKTVHPSFAVFIREPAPVKTDHSFSYDSAFSETGPMPTNVRHKPNRPPTVWARKTEVKVPFNEEALSTVHNSYHMLNKCQAFRRKTIDERKNFLHENMICQNCCGPGKHSSKDCKAKIKCYICDSNAHPTAMHLGRPDTLPTIVRGRDQDTDGSNHPNRHEIPTPDVAFHHSHLREIVDLVNNLLGVLLRFRRESIAIITNVEQMLYCFQIYGNHRNFLRFFWYEGNTIDGQLIKYRMTSHVFGNSPSSAVATYGIRKAVETAVSLLKRTQQALLLYGNIRLHKVVSNSNDVLTAVDQGDIAGDFKYLHLQTEASPLQKKARVVLESLRGLLHL